MTRKNLKVGSWNVNGLCSKIFDKSSDNKFLEEIQSYDIIGLLETKLGDIENLNFNGYHSVYVKRPTEEKYPVSGGILILVKSSIKRGVSFIPNKSSELQWLKLSKEYFGFSDDLFICFAYIAPSNSSYVIRHDLHILDKLEQDILMFKSKGQILICGDLNARTGESSINFVDNDEHIPVPLDTKNNSTSQNRKSSDKIVCSRGKELLDLCTALNLRILNGGAFGDSCGK